MVILYSGHSAESIVINPGCLIERSAIEQNRTPNVRLCSAIEHNRTHKKFCKSNTIERSIIERLAIELNRQEMQSKQNQTGLGSIAFDLFDNRTHTKLDVRLCSIAQRNGTIGVRLCSIGFLFDFVRLDTPGIKHVFPESAILHFISKT